MYIKTVFNVLATLYFICSLYVNPTVIGLKNDGVIIVDTFLSFVIISHTVFLFIICVQRSFNYSS